MKILRIENGTAQFWSVRQQQYLSIDQIGKNELLSLLEFFLENDVEMDQVDDDNLRNQAHLVIYNSILGKLEALERNKTKFKDESDRLYLDEIRKYSE